MGAVGRDESPKCRHLRGRRRDDQLLEKLNTAVKAVNDTEKDVATAQAELVSRSKRVGLLLLGRRSNTRQSRISRHS